jgi:hypothetical protein
MSTDKGEGTENTQRLENTFSSSWRRLRYNLAHRSWWLHVGLE